MGSCIKIIFVTLENTFKIMSSKLFVRFPENVERSAQNEAVNKPPGLKRTLSYCKLQWLGLTLELFAFFIYQKKRQQNFEK